MRTSAQCILCALCMYCVFSNYKLYHVCRPLVSELNISWNCHRVLLYTTIFGVVGLCGICCVFITFDRRPKQKIYDEKLSIVILIYCLLIVSFTWRGSGDWGDRIKFITRTNYAILLLPLLLLLLLANFSDTKNYACEYRKVCYRTFFFLLPSALWFDSRKLLQLIPLRQLILILHAFFTVHGNAIKIEVNPLGYFPEEVNACSIQFIFPRWENVVRASRRFASGHARKSDYYWIYAIFSSSHFWLKFNFLAKNSR